MGLSRHAACVATLPFALTLTLGTAAAAETPFARLAGLYAEAVRPELEQAAVDETWAGRCAIVDSPQVLHGALESFFVTPDPVLGDSAWAVEVVRRGDAGWPSRATRGELEAARREARSGRRYFSALTATETALATRFVQRGPGVVVDNLNELRVGAAEDGSALWLLRVGCNLTYCQSFNGGPVLRRGDAIAYCYFNERVLPVAD
jgi:hypothetical protein